MRDMEVLFSALFVCYASYTYNRRCVALALPSLMEEGLDATHAGFIISSQNVAFAISKFAAGILSDKVNPNLLFTSGLIASGLVTLLFCNCNSVAGFASLWFANGLAQGCGWPAIAKILRQRASPTQFGTWWSLLSSANNMAGSVSPFLSAYIILNYGWRWSLTLAGCSSICLGSSFIFSQFLASSRSSTYHSSTEESKHSENSANRKEKVGSESIYDLLSDPFMWFVSFCFMVVFCAKTTTVDWGQIYIIKERKHTQYAASAFTSSVESGGFVGRIAAGYIADYVIKRQMTSATKQPNSGARMKVALWFMMVQLVGLHAFRVIITETSSMTLLTLLGFLMGMSMYGSIAIFGIVASESAPAHLSGASHAIAALAANVGAVVSGLPFSYIAKYYEWSSLFILLEVSIFFTILIMYICRNLQSFNVRKNEIRKML